MATTRIFVDQQLLLTLFLVMLLWSLHARLHKQDFFRWWAWAWTSFTGYLGMGALALRLTPAWTFLKESLMLAALVCGFLQVPLLAFGACALRGQGKPRRVWLRTGILVALAASALIFAAALYYRQQPFTSFAVRTAPRTLALAASLFFCAWVFIRQGRRTRSLAAVVTGGFCSLYALDQSFYSLIYINQFVSGLRPPAPALPFSLLQSPMPFFFDLLFELGMCLGVVLLLVEAHERTELALLTSNARADMIAENNVALQAEIAERKRMEEALRESEDRYRDLVEHSQDLICTHDLAGKLLSCNPAPARILGYNVAELLAISMRDIIAPEYRERFDEYLARMKTVGADKGLMSVITRTGERRIWEYDNTLRVEGVPYPIVRGMAHDITERTQAERELRASEDKLRLLLDSTAEAIYGIDLEHRCTFCNPACLRALGYKRIDEVLGKNMHDLIHHTRTDGTLFPVEECRVHSVLRTGEGDHAQDEAFWRANGTSFPVEYWSYPQRKGQGVIGAVVAFLDITQRKLAEAALASVSRRLIEAQEQERTRIARELHDDIVQRLAFLAMELEQLRQTPPDSPANVGSRVGELWKQTSEIATDVQSLSHELHSSKLQYLGIAAAVRAFCKEFSEQQNVEIDCQTHDLPSPLPPDISLCLFRVLQEALHNSAKHSGVRHFEVRLWGTPRELHLTVTDSGAGFDREAAKESRGLGLISMEERLKLVSGTLSVDSQPKRGTIIHARVPLGSESGSMSAAG